MTGERFDEHGMLIIPNQRRPHWVETPSILVITRSFCPQGHSLISKRTSFNGFPGILLRVKKNRHKGLIALSPIYGEKVRIAIDIDLESGELLQLFCPECDMLLPEHSQCPNCEGQMVAFFSTPAPDFANCIAICNRVDCPNATVTRGGELVSQTMLDAG